MKALGLLPVMIALSSPAVAADVPPWEKDWSDSIPASPYTAGAFEQGCALVDLAIASPERLSSSDRAAAHACTFYFLGVSQSLAAASHLGAKGICPPPPGLRPSDIVEKFKAFVRAYPESRNSDVMPVTIAALMRAYPCAQ